MIPFIVLSYIACAPEKVDTGLDTGGGLSGSLDTDADGDGFTLADDCDDADDQISPAAEEICDGIDNNCDGAIDEGVTATFYADDDGDGFGDGEDATESCSEPTGYVGTGNDCDDADAESYPGAAERCDGADNDCDGDTDEDVTDEWFADADADGYGDIGVLVEDCDPPSGYVADSSDCDDLDALTYPGAEEVCDAADNNCDAQIDEGVTTTYYRDEDGDNFGVADATTEACARPGGHAEVSGDCDDHEAAVNPGVLELCDGTDNDCDGTTDEDDAADTETFFADVDGDGYGDPRVTADACAAPSGHVSDDTDCDDADSNINPGAAEVCNDTDDDCNGWFDEDDPGITDATTYYVDADRDGYGLTGYTVEDCEQPSGYAEAGGDCDDGSSDTYPGASELCDSADNDCDGTADEDAIDTVTYYADGDADGYGDPDDSTDACAPPSGYVGRGDDCDDTDSGSYPGASEVCDEADNDCDGDVDEEAVDEETYYADSDADGYGDVASATQACAAPSGYTSDSTDCDDTDSGISPGAEEVCGGGDEDCDGLTDEADSSLSDATTYYIDLDRDGYGSTLYAVDACAQPANFSALDTDCDDSDGGTYPGAAESCDEEDNDCDGTIDEGVTLTLHDDADRDGYGDPAATSSGCAESAGSVLDDSDCDDTDSTISPAAEEVCDSIDNDCDGSVDAGATDAAEFYADADGDGYGDPDDSTASCAAPSGHVSDGTDCDDTDSRTSPGAAEACDEVDNDCDGVTDEGLEGTDALCPGETCQAILDLGLDDGDGLYWIDPDGDGADAWEAYCDMTDDGGGWTKVFSSHYPTWWTRSDWEDVGDAEDDDYSALFARDDFEDADGVWTLRLEVGNSGTWDTATRSHYTVWSQEHDPLDETTDGSDYVYSAGAESSTCGGFNGLHNQYYTSSGVYTRTSDVDLYDSYGCWWMQVVPLQQYGTASSYPGYLEGYGGSGNVHTWQVLWVR